MDLFSGRGYSSFDAVSQASVTPLHNAAAWGNLDVGRILIGAGADIMLTDKVMWHPLSMCVDGTVCDWPVRC